MANLKNDRTDRRMRNKSVRRLDFEGRKFVPHHGRGEHEHAVVEANSRVTADWRKYRPSLEGENNPFSVNYKAKDSYESKSNELDEASIKPKSLQRTKHVKDVKICSVSKVRLIIHKNVGKQKLKSLKSQKITQFLINKKTNDGIDNFKRKYKQEQLRYRPTDIFTDDNALPCSNSENQPPAVDMIAKREEEKDGHSRENTENGNRRKMYSSFEADLLPELSPPVCRTNHFVVTDSLNSGTAMIHGLSPSRKKAIGSLWKESCVEVPHETSTSLDKTINEEPFSPGFVVATPPDGRRLKKKIRLNKILAAKVKSPIITSIAPESDLKSSPSFISSPSLVCKRKRSMFLDSKLKPSSCGKIIPKESPKKVGIFTNKLITSLQSSPVLCTKMSERPTGLCSTGNMTQCVIPRSNSSSTNSLSASFTPTAIAFRSKEQPASKDPIIPRRHSDAASKSPTIDRRTQKRIHLDTLGKVLVRSLSEKTPVKVSNSLSRTLKMSPEIDSKMWSELISFNKLLTNKSKIASDSTTPEIIFDQGVVIDLPENKLLRERVGSESHTKTSLDDSSVCQNQMLKDCVKPGYGMVNNHSVHSTLSAASRSTSTTENLNNCEKLAPPTNVCLENALREGAIGKRHRGNLEMSPPISISMQAPRSLTMHDDASISLVSSSNKLKRGPSSRLYDTEMSPSCCTQNMTAKLSPPVGIMMPKSQSLHNATAMKALSTSVSSAAKQLTFQSNDAASDVKKIAYKFPESQDCIPSSLVPAPVKKALSRKTLNNFLSKKKDSAAIDDCYSKINREKCLISDNAATEISKSPKSQLACDVEKLWQGASTTLKKSDNIQNLNCTGVPCYVNAPRSPDIMDDVTSFFSANPNINVITSPATKEPCVLSPTTGGHGRDEPASDLRVFLPTIQSPNQCESYRNCAKLPTLENCIENRAPSQILDKIVANEPSKIIEDVLVPSHIIAGIENCKPITSRQNLTPSPTIEDIPVINNCSSHILTKNHVASESNLHVTSSVNHFTKNHSPSPNYDGHKICPASPIIAEFRIPPQTAATHRSPGNSTHHQLPTDSSKERMAVKRMRLKKLWQINRRSPKTPQNEVSLTTPTDNALKEPLSEVRQIKARRNSSERSVVRSDCETLPVDVPGDIDSVLLPEISLNHAKKALSDGDVRYKRPKVAVCLRKRETNISDSSLKPLSTNFEVRPLSPPITSHPFIRSCFTKKTAALPHAVMQTTISELENITVEVTKDSPPVQKSYETNLSPKAMPSEGIASQGCIGKSSQREKISSYIQLSKKCSEIEGAILKDIPRKHLRRFKSPNNSNSVPKNNFADKNSTFISPPCSSSTRLKSAPCDVVDVSSYVLRGTNSDSKTDPKPPLPSPPICSPPRQRNKEETPWKIFEDTEDFENALAAYQWKQNMNANSEINKGAFDNPESDWLSRRPLNQLLPPPTFPCIISQNNSMGSQRADLVNPETVSKTIKPIRKNISSQSGLSSNSEDCSLQSVVRDRAVDKWKPGQEGASQLADAEGKCEIKKLSPEIFQKWKLKVPARSNIETQAIDEFYTEALHLAGSCTKAEGWNSEGKISEILSDERYKQTKSQDAPQTALELLPKKSKSRKSLVAELQMVRRAFASERRLQAYEQGKRDDKAQSALRLQVVEMWGKLPLRVRAVSPEGPSIVLISKGLLKTPNSIYPGCYLTIYSPWDVEAGTDSHPPIYMSIRTCDVTYGKLAAEEMPKPIQELPLTPYQTRPHNLIREFLNLSNE